MEIIVEAEKLKKKYGRVEALNNINIKIERAKCYALLGSNGSGKSTLFRIISNITPKTSGRLTVFGENKIDNKIRNKLHYLPDENNLYLWMKLDEVEWFFSNLYENWNHELMKELITFLKIPSRKVSTMSRGERVRLKLSIAFSTGVELLLLDDPLLGIDVKSRAMIIDAINNFWNPEKQTLFISSHIINEIEGLFDYVFFINKGEIILEGEADNLRKQYKKSLESIAKEDL